MQLQASDVSRTLRDIHQILSLKNAAGNETWNW